MRLGVAGSRPGTLLNSTCKLCRRFTSIYTTASISSRPAAAKIHASTLVGGPKLQVRSSASKASYKRLMSISNARNQSWIQMEKGGEGAILVQARLAGQGRGISRCQGRSKRQQAVCSTAGAVAAPFGDAGGQNRLLEVATHPL